MPALSAPRITRAQITPGTWSTGTILTVEVEWEGQPRAQPTYQWRDGTRVLRGHTSTAFFVGLPGFGDVVDPNCVVRIDNGRGTATAVAIPVIEDEPVTPVPGGFVFEAGVFEIGVFE